MEKKITISIRINPALWERAKELAADLDTSGSDLISEGLTKLIEEKRVDIFINDYIEEITNIN